MPLDRQPGFVEVHVIDEFWRETKRVLIVGRAYPGAPKGWLKQDGTWEPLSEAVAPDDNVGFTFPAGTLEALVAAVGDQTAPQPATERHLTDAIEVRDRLLTLVEKKR